MKHFILLISLFFSLSLTAQTVYDNEFTIVCWENTAGDQETILATNWNVRSARNPDPSPTRYYKFVVGTNQLQPVTPTGGTIKIGHCITPKPDTTYISDFEEVCFKTATDTISVFVVIQYVNNVETNRFFQNATTGAPETGTALSEQDCLQQLFDPIYEKLDTIETTLNNVEDSIAVTNELISKVIDTLDVTNDILVNIEDSIAVTNELISEVIDTLDVTNDLLQEISENTEQQPDYETKEVCVSGNLIVQTFSIVDGTETLLSSVDTGNDCFVQSECLCRNNNQTVSISGTNTFTVESKTTCNYSVTVFRGEVEVNGILVPLGGTNGNGTECTLLANDVKIVGQTADTYAIIEITQ